MTGKSRQAFRTISEVSAELELPQHVLRFWETKFSQVRPLKRGGNRRYYRPEDIELLRAIKKLLHQDGFTIKGVQKQFREHGLKATVQMALDGGAPLVSAADDRPRQVASRSPESAGSDVASKAELTAILTDLKSIKRLLDES